MTTVLYGPHLPWTRLEEEEQRFRRILGRVLLLVLILAVAIPNVPLPILEAESQPELPPRVVRVLVGDRVLAPAVDEPEEVVEPIVQEPTASETAVAAEAPGAGTTDVAPLPPAATARAVRPSPDSPRARDSGVLALQDTLAALRSRPSSFTGGGVRADPGVTVPDMEPREGSAFTLKDADETAATGVSQLVDRSPVTIARLQPITTQAAERASSNARSVREPTSRRTKHDGVSRSREEIQEILDRHKGAIYALYNRELERDPSLSGRVILSLTISSSGIVTACRVTNTELGAPAFERKLVQQIKRIDFGPKPEAAPVTTTVPIEFLPT